MRETKAMTSILWVIMGASLLSQSSLFGQTAAPPATPARPTQIFLTNAELDPNESLQVIRAFVRTRSLSANCLATMGDTSFVATGTIIFCAPRQPAGLGKGVLISVFYPVPPSDGLTLTVTLWQDGAQRYDAPVLCNVNGC